MTRALTWLVVFGLTALSAAVAGRPSGMKLAKPLTSVTSPDYCKANHNVGRVVLGVGNNGALGTSFGPPIGDCFTGDTVVNCEYPAGSNTVYLYGASLWVGAVVGEDTLVSTSFQWGLGGNEFHPDEPPHGGMLYRSTLNPTSPASEDAVSEQDFIARYTDTCLNCPGLGDDPYDGRPHLPLGIEVTQSSYAWSHSHAEDFVLLEYSIRNMGEEALPEVFFGLFVDGDVHPVGQYWPSGMFDDIAGFLGTHTHPLLPAGCEDNAEVNLAWTADNDGELTQTQFPSVPHVTGVRFLGRQPMNLRQSFNWWHQSFGPQARTNYRIFPDGGIGVPAGDRARYYVMSNGEIDYDQVRTATIGGLDPIWPPPSVSAGLLAGGTEISYLLSIGPFDLEPDQELSIPLAYVAGENLHTIEGNLANLPDNPDEYLTNLDFSDLAANAIRAEWVYDNPGVDSDGDGYAGEYRLCGEDTVWIRGDGVPDWKATSDPRTPAFWVEPEPLALRLRWNGFESETAVDNISREPNFEGYRAYLSTTGEPGSYACLAMYDIEDYVSFAWDTAASDWVLRPERLTLKEACCRFAPDGCDDPTWHPLDYPRQNPYVLPSALDSVFYFEPIGVNACRFGLETPFVKRFPDAILPPYPNPDLVPTNSVETYLTPDGYFKYYEYEYLIEELLPLRDYWVVITAFDYGSLRTGAGAVESGVAPKAVVAEPFPDPRECCQDRVGNVDCDPAQIVDIADVTHLIDHLYIDHTRLCCVAAADLNRSGGDSPTVDDLTLGDVAILIDHLFINQEELPWCF